MACIGGRFARGAGRAAAAMTALMILAPLLARAAEVVALGADYTQGEGVAPTETYPAQLEAMLRTKGFAVAVANAGVSGDTTAGMLSRFDSVVDSSTRVLALQPGYNDESSGISNEDAAANVIRIVVAASARHIKVVMVRRKLYYKLPRQGDNIHLTPEGNHSLAALLLPQVVSALGK